MLRPRSSVFVLSLPAVMGLLLTTAGCSSSPEKELLTKYFQASKLRDNGTLANIATVAFAPTEEGIVQSFDVVSVGAEQKRTLKLKELAAAEQSARQADDEFNKKKREYQDANRTAIERVLQAENSNGKLKGADLAVQTAWTQWREETAKHAKALAEARQALARERGLAEASVFDARNPVDATKYDGELITKDVQLKARVRNPAGQVQDRDLHVTMTRVQLTNGPEGKSVDGRWIITHISDSQGAPPS